MADKFRCPVCGHWCIWADGAWFCGKRGGCEAEWNDEEWDAGKPDPAVAAQAGFDGGESTGSWRD